MIKTRAFVTLIALAIWSAACGTGSAPEKAGTGDGPTPPAATAPALSGSGGGVIAFVSSRDGTQDINIMNADGSDRRRLTTGSANEGWASWSPDGALIAFHSILSGSTLKILEVSTG